MKKTMGEKKRYGMGFILIVVFSLLFAKTVFWLKQKPMAPVEESSLPVFGEIPAFELTASTGESFGLEFLKGKVWIASFVFTRCSGPCPLISAKMSSLQTKLSNQKNVQLVSFSVDPDYDTPEVLTQYAKKFNADPEKWVFLTGEKAEIHELVLRHFHLGVGDIPEEDRESLDQAIQHSTKLVLVDSQSRIRGYYDSQETENLDKLLAETQELLREEKLLLSEPA